jgi:hypothetical protein
MWPDACRCPSAFPSSVSRRSLAPGARLRSPPRATALSPRLPRVTGPLVGGLAILPVGLPLLLIAWYSVDVPFWDQWWTARLFVRLAEGSLSVADLFEPHAEYRQFFPHLLFLGLGVATRWRVRYEMLVSVLLACLVSLNIYRISRTTIGRGETRLWLLAAANLLIFSPVQYENWLFGIQVVYFAPIACLTACLSVAYSRASPATKFVVAAVLSVIATFSAANGVLCWVLRPTRIERSCTVGGTGVSA